jgi:hypothetical protein
MIANWNLLLKATSLKKILYSYFSFKKKEFAFLFILLIFAFLGSIFFCLQVLQAPQKVVIASQIIKKTKIMHERKELIEEESRRSRFAQINKVLLEVFNAHKKKELEIVSQFNGFEDLKGHESKLFLDPYSFDAFYEEKTIQKTPPYQEITYGLKNPVYLTDLELKNLITGFEKLKSKNPAILVNFLSFKKKMIEHQEKYEVNFTFIIREKMANSSYNEKF